MPPAKSRNGAHDESKPDSANSQQGSNSKDGHHGHGYSKEKSGHGTATGSNAHQNHQNNQQQSNGGKMRRAASSAGSSVRDVTSNMNLAVPLSISAAHAPNSSVASPPSTVLASAVNYGTGPTAQISGVSGVPLQWSSFDRPVLHLYRRLYRLNTPTSYINDYHRWVLSRPGSLGLQSPTMVRNKAFRRQGKDELAGVVRKHLNSQALQENDVIVDFIHKIRTSGGGVSKPTRTRRREGDGQK